MAKVTIARQFPSRRCCTPRAMQPMRAGAKREVACKRVPSATCGGSDLRPRLAAGAVGAAGLASAGERTAGDQPALECRSALCPLFVGPKGQQHAINPATGRVSPGMVLEARSPHRLGVDRRSVRVASVCCLYLCCHAGQQATPVPGRAHPSSSREPCPEPRRFSCSSGAIVRRQAAGRFVLYPQPPRPRPQG